MTKSEYADLTYFMIYRYKLVKNSEVSGLFFHHDGGDTTLYATDFRAKCKLPP